MHQAGAGDILIKMRVPRGPIMCLKGKKEAKDKPGNFRCKNCGAISKKKARLCDPKKIK